MASSIDVVDIVMGVGFHPPTPNPHHVTLDNPLHQPTSYHWPPHMTHPPHSPHPTPPHPHILMHLYTYPSMFVILPVSVFRPPPNCCQFQFVDPPPQYH